MGGGGCCCDSSELELVRIHAFTLVAEFGHPGI